MRKLVVELAINGEVRYLCGQPSLFNQQCLTDNAASATDYSDEKEARNLERHLSAIVLPEDEWYARSGVRAESCSLVEVEIKVRECNRRIAREPHKSN